MFACGVTLLARHDEGHDDAPTALSFRISKTTEVNITADVKIASHLLKKANIWSPIASKAFGTSSR
jgi:hypothetical protein